MKSKLIKAVGVFIGILILVFAIEKGRDSIQGVRDGYVEGVKTTEVQDAENNFSTLTIMTFNAELLWDGVAPEEGRLEFPWKGDEEKAREHMKKIAEVIRKENPDIVNLVEVENINALNTFNTTFLKDLGYHAYLVNGRDTYTGEDVALLSKIVPDGGKIYRDDREGTSNGVKKSVSKNYYAYFQVGGLKFVLIGIHFLAEPLNAGRSDQRQAQADAIRSLAIEKWNEGYQVVIAGDFNDYDSDAKSLDHIGSAPITAVLADMRAMDLETPADDLANVASFIPKPERYTAFYDKNSNGRVDAPKELTSIDHILLSSGLASYVKSAEIAHTYDPKDVSDHFPVVVQLQTQ